tara:strand:- start:427 stop:585 length:159 start_codon:yes stop_codon:yes gene_type:complete
MKLTYWEREFIREGGAKLEKAHRKVELDNLKGSIGDAAHKSFLLYPPKTSKK